MNKIKQTKKSSETNRQEQSTYNLLPINKILKEKEKPKKRAEKV